LKVKTEERDIHRRKKQIYTLLVVWDEVGEDASRRRHLRELIGHSVEHLRVIVDAVAGLHSGHRRKRPAAVICRDQRRIAWFRGKNKKKKKTPVQTSVVPCGSMSIKVTVISEPQSQSQCHDRKSTCGTVR
jgi:hypothetical protein